MAETIACSEAEPPASLARVYDAHAPEIFRFLRRMGVPDAALDDAVQDVFFVAWRRREDFEGRSSERTWLYGIARKTARNYRRLRDRALRESHDVEHLSVSHDPARSSEAAEAARMVDAALARMSDTLREAFILVEIEQLSAPEIAVILAVPVNTVYSRTRLARQHFRSSLNALQSEGTRP